jgi:tetratricopeptide (TPR) repeat protein
MPASCRVLALVLALALAGSLQAASEWPVPRAASHGPSPYVFDPVAAKKVPREFLDDAVTCVLHAGTTHLVEPDGTIETITHEVTRLNGRKGIDKYGEFTGITYDPAYQKLTLNEARLHKAKGGIVAVEPRHVHLRDVSTDYQVYAHEKQLIISFPGLEVGDCIEVQWTVRGKNPEHAGHFFTRYTLGDDTNPVMEDELFVRVPAGRILKHTTVGGTLTPAVTEKEGTRLYHWKVENRKQLPQDANQPSKEELRLQVACSTFASWEEIGRWKKGLKAECWDCTREIKQIVADVTKGLTNPTDKARALTYWARRNLRYVSRGDTHDFTPHKPADVLANRFGDCKDTSQFLAVMLREAGIRVGLVTLGVLGDGQVLEEVPSPWGTHAIVVAFIDGKEHWIDTTASLAGWDQLPTDDRNRVCYVIENDKLRLLRTPKSTPEDNKVEQTTILTIGADGSSRGERTATYHGLAAYGQRHDWYEVPRGERRRLVASDLQDNNSRTRLIRLAIDEATLGRFDGPVSARTVFEIPGHFSGSPDREGSITDSRVWNRLLGFTLDYDRTTPLDLSGLSDSRHRYVITLAPCFTIDSPPRERNLRSPWGSFTVGVKFDPENPAHLEIDYHLRLERDRVEPKDFDEFRKFHQEVADAYRSWLTLRPSLDLARAPALEALLQIAPDDTANAIALTKLYITKGMLDEARRVLARARHYSPDEALLWELSVKAAEKLEDEELAQRELVKRFPEEPRHAVALGAILIDRGKFKEAQAVLDTAVGSDTPAHQAQAYYQLARSAHKQKQFSQALEYLDKAAAADDDSVRTARAFELRGKLLESLKRPREAAEAYKKALDFESDQSECVAALVRIALDAGDRTEALARLRRYTLLVGNELSGLLIAADFHLRLGRYDDAFELASRAREQRFHESAQRILGFVHLHRGEFQKAVDFLAKADASPDVLEALLRAHLTLGQLHEAGEVLQRHPAVRNPTGSYNAVRGIVELLLQQRDALLLRLAPPKEKRIAWMDAVDAYLCADFLDREGRRRERVEPILANAFPDGLELGYAFALRARLALDKGKLAKALTDAERAIKHSPEDARGWYVRGRVRQERGVAGALDDLAKAAELTDRKDVAVLQALAQAEADAGRAKEALATVREALVLAPENTEVKELLQTLEKNGKTPGEK